MNFEEYYKICNSLDEIEEIISKSKIKNLIGTYLNKIDEIIYDSLSDNERSKAINSTKLNVYYKYFS